jgi:RNA polymerase sigma-70 factor (ECF subfamily)
MDLERVIMSVVEQQQPAGESALTDEEVIARVLAGDTALFELVMRRHNQRIYRTVRAILRRDEEVEDVMQQTYLNAFRHLAQFAGDARFATWLTSIAVNEAVARLRRGRMAEARDAGDEPIAILRSKEADPESEAIGAQITKVVEQAILNLPERYRAVLILRRVEGLSTEETAASLGIRTDAVKTRLKRARMMLREDILERTGISLEGLFAFCDTRCSRIVGAVLAEIA